MISRFSICTLFPVSYTHLDVYKRQGMDRALRANVITKSGKAVETAGDIDTLLLDKTGTITIGNRKATHFHTAPGVDLHRFVGSTGQLFAYLCIHKIYCAMTIQQMQYIVALNRHYLYFFFGFHHYAFENLANDLIVIG